MFLSGWKPPWLLPSPLTVFGELWQQLIAGDLLAAVAVTLRRAAVGFGLAIVVGGVIGILVVRSRTLRAAVGSLITGLQTMPSIAWFPLAILLFQLSETAILFVVVLGAAPAIANGLISGVDHVPPLLLRAGRVLGATGLANYRYVILPAALPASVAGLKQGWAFAWRSLMAGELLVLIPGQTSVGCAAPVLARVLRRRRADGDDDRHPPHRDRRRRRGVQLARTVDPGAPRARRCRA